MSESRPSVDPKLSFIAGWLLGRRRRNRSGAGCLFLAIGLFAAMSSVAGLIGAPISWMESRAAQRLPQPSSAELQSVVPGNRTASAGPAAPGSDRMSMALFSPTLRNLRSRHQPIRPTVEGMSQAERVRGSEILNHRGRLR